MEQFRVCERKKRKENSRKFNKCGMLHAIQYVIRLAFFFFGILEEDFMSVFGAFIFMRICYIDPYKCFL